MKHYLADGHSDWGTLYLNEGIRASNLRTAFGRAASVAIRRLRERGKRAKSVSIKVILIGSEPR